MSWTYHRTPIATASFVFLLLSLVIFPPLGACSPEPEPAGEAEAAARDTQRLPRPGRAWVIFGEDTVRAEVARTAAEKEEGLMYRSRLEEGQGMLFVYPDAQIRSFWMRNTVIPLDIAFLDADLRIVDIQSMEPESLDSHESAAPAMFALEVPMGWFQKKEIGVGERARVVFGPGT